MSKAVGFIDAYKDKKFLSKCFIPTKCYKKAGDPDINFICGRRGSGKSAIVLNLKKSPDYQYADHVEGPQFYQQFLKSIRPIAIQEIDTTFLFITIWKHLILTTAMNAIITQRYAKDYDYVSLADKPMYDYLKLNEFLGKKPLSMWQKIIRALKNVIGNEKRRPNIVNDILQELTVLLENDDFSLAEQSLKDHLQQNGRCIVIVDTILDFFKKEQLFIDCVEGLIYAVLDLTCQQYCEELEVKCCIPGEIYPRLKMWEKSKVKDHLVPLQWTPRDLIRMISKRMMYHIVLNKSATIKEFNDIDWSNYKEVKRNVWDRYFPTEITNIQNGSEKTHVYILRHTQHTPREFIRLMNEILDEYEDNIHDDMDCKELRKAIIKGVHVSNRDTVHELIDSNQYIIPNLDKILKTSFQSKQKVMKIQDVRQYLTHSKKYWKESVHIAEEDLIIEELFSMGFLGLVMNYETESLALKTRFSYLEPDFGTEKDCHLAIHPMFYETYNIKRNIDRFVYPSSSLGDFWAGIDSIEEDNA